MNTQTADPQVQKAHDELIAKRDRFVLILAPLLRQAGWVVTGDEKMPTALWQGGQLIATKPEIHSNFKMYYQFEIKGTNWHRGLPTKLMLKVGQETGYRSHATRYTKLDEALARKLVQEIELTLKGVIDYEQRQAEANDMQARFEQRRVMELAGYLNPPGTDIKIWTGNGPHAGQYGVSFGQGSITSQPLTRDQLIKLINVLNEIQGSTDALIIVSKAQDNSEQVWGAHGWWASQNPHLYATAADAQHDLARAMEQSRKPETVEIVRYDSRFTIKPGNPVTKTLY